MRILGAILGAILGVAIAGGAEAACTVPFTFVNNTQIADANQVNANFAAVAACAGTGGSGIVTSLVALESLPASSPPTIVAALTAPPVVYIASATPCTINDGGSCVPTSDGGGWNISPQSAYDIRWWGLTSNPINFYVSPAGNDFGSPGAGANFCVVSALPCLTIQQAHYQADRFWAAGASMIINIAVGTYNNISEFQNGPLLGAASTKLNPLTPTPNGMGVSVLTYQGAGAATIINGSTAHCSTFQASNQGIIGVANMTINSPSSCGISLGVQQGGQGFDFGGITWGPATSQMMWAQDAGSLIVAVGSDTLAGSAADFIGSSGQSQFQTLSGPFQYTVAVGAGLSFPSGFITVSGNAEVLLGGSGLMFTGSSITGSPFISYNNGRIQNQTGRGYGLFPTGTGVSAAYNYSGMYPAPVETVQAVCPDIDCGTGSSTTVTGTTRTGVVTITGGTGAGAIGALNIQNNVGLFMDTSPALPVCHAFPLVGGTFTGVWDVGVTFVPTKPIDVGTEQIWTINFNNNTGTLVNGATYGIGYSCTNS